MKAQKLAGQIFQFIEHFNMYDMTFSFLGKNIAVHFFPW